MTAQQLQDLLAQQAQDLTAWMASRKLPKQPRHPGIPGTALRGLSLSPDLADEIMKAIEEECERVEPFSGELPA